jgi:hypothetical protein
MFKNWLLLLGFCCVFSLHAEKKMYNLPPGPIDVVMVTHPKDKHTVEACIQGIRENGKNIRRVVIVSSENLTEQAEWFDEKNFPFTKNEVALTIGRGSKKKSDQFFNRTSRGAGWYYQQLLKLYSPFVIPGLSNNVLVVDSDAIFLNPVDFINEQGGGLFCVSYLQPHEAYIKHAERLVPAYKRIHPDFYSVCHHMLFQKPILKDLFSLVERKHNKRFWIAFCHAVDIEGKKKGASEYEIYYNFALRNTDQVAIRDLIWVNSSHLEDLPYYKRDGYHFVAFHTYMRGKWPSPYQAERELVN